MAKITINLLGWNHRDIIEKAIDSVLTQSYRDFELVYMDNASSDGSQEFVRHKFPQVKVIQNEKNLGYAGGHNLFFKNTDTEFLMVLNPDAVLDKNFLLYGLSPFEDDGVAAVTGKMLKSGSDILDGTGIIFSRSRRFRERGQNEKDAGQYDTQQEIFGVSGTAGIYRKSALEKVKVPKNDGEYEYFDEDFFAYFEDVDLAWRLNLAGFKARFAPKAVVYHARTAGSSPGGYKNFFSFVRHHKQLPQKVKEWNWKNHLFCIVKNDSGVEFFLAAPLIFARELAMFFFILVFETRTLKILPKFFHDLPKMFRKRKFIKNI